MNNIVFFILGGLVVLMVWVYHEVCEVEKGISKLREKLNGGKS